MWVPIGSPRVGRILERLVCQGCTDCTVMNSLKFFSLVVGVGNPTQKPAERVRPDALADGDSLLDGDGDNEGEPAAVGNRCWLGAALCRASYFVARAFFATPHPSHQVKHLKRGCHSFNSGLGSSEIKPELRFRLASSPTVKTLGHQGCLWPAQY